MIIKIYPWILQRLNFVIQLLFMNIEPLIYVFVIKISKTMVLQIR